MDVGTLITSIEASWNQSVIDYLEAYIRIPNKSPAFDPDWEAHGHMEAALQLVMQWCRAQSIPGMRVEIRRLAGRTPLLWIAIDGELPGTALLYGHLDKQPEFVGWSEGLGPWKPVVRDGKLYGRGGADDGYATFSALTAIAALKEQGIPLARFVLIIEASEESGSTDLPAHLDALGSELGTPSLVVCLDAECGDYERLWCTTSLRGNISGRLRVRVLTQGVHSGFATGIAPSPFRIAGQLLARIEEPVTGEIRVTELQAAIPEDRLSQITATAQVLDAGMAANLPWASGVRPISSDPVDLIKNSTWRATLAITGADGLPSVASAGNVLLPEVVLCLSFRLPPTCDATRASAALRETLERDSPYGAQVTFEVDSATSGWNAPVSSQWLEDSITSASERVFGQKACQVGCGGTIPFMGMLGRRFTGTQFFVTGVLGPHANAHGPDESLHLGYACNLTACVALLLADHAQKLQRDTT